MLRALRMRSLLPFLRMAAAGALAGALAARTAAAQTVTKDDEVAPPTVLFSISQGSGARALGMGGAFLARPDDATAASWNPAGLSVLARPELSLAGLVTSGRSVGTQPGPQPGDPPQQLHTEELESMTPDFLALALPFEFKRARGAFQVSFQRVIPLGGHRRIVRTARDRRIELDTKGGFDVIAASMGVRVSRRLSLGATLNRWFNGYEANFARVTVDPEVRETDLSFSDWSVNGGLIWEPIDNVNFGLVGKTPFHAEASLWRRRKDYVHEPRTEFRVFRNGLELTFPGAVGVGTSWRIANPLTASADYTRTFWSKARVRNYFELTALGAVNTYDAVSFPSTTKPGQEDTQQFRVGVEYVLFFGEVRCPLRAGYFNDRQYFRQYYTSSDPEAPVTEGPPPHFNAFTAGTGFAVGGLLFDVAYVHERGTYFDSLKYDRTNHRVFFSMIVRYGRY